MSFVDDKIAAIIGELSLKLIIPDGDTERATLATTDDTLSKKSADFFLSCCNYFTSCSVPEHFPDVINSVRNYDYKT